MKIWIDNIGRKLALSGLPSPAHNPTKGTSTSQWTMLSMQNLVLDEAASQACPYAAIVCWQACEGDCRRLCTNTISHRLGHGNLDRYRPAEELGVDDAGRQNFVKELVGFSTERSQAFTQTAPVHRAFTAQLVSCHHVPGRTNAQWHKHFFQYLINSVEW